MEKIYRVGWANSLGWLFEKTDWRTFEISGRDNFEKPYLAGTLQVLRYNYIDFFFLTHSAEPNPTESLKAEFLNRNEFFFPKGWLEKLWDDEIAPNWAEISEPGFSAFDRFFPQDMNDVAYSQLHVYQFAPTGHVLETFNERAMPGTSQNEYYLQYRTIYDKRPYYKYSMSPGTFVTIVVIPDRIANCNFGNWSEDISSDSIDTVNSALLALLNDEYDSLATTICIDAFNNNGVTLYNMELDGTKVLNKLDDLLTTFNYTGWVDAKMKFSPFNDPNASDPLDVSYAIVDRLHPETIKFLRDLLLSKYNRYPYDISAKYHPPVDAEPIGPEKP